MTQIGSYGTTYSTTYSGGSGTVSGVSQYNPSNPDIAGQEWFAARVRNIALGASIGRAARFTASVSEDVDQIAGYFVVNQPSGNNPNSAVICCDIYDLTVTPSPFVPETTIVGLPTGNGAVDANGLGIGAGWQKLSGLTFSAYDTNAHNNVDDLLTSTSDLDVAGIVDNIAYSAGTSAPQIARFRTNTGLYDFESGAASGDLTSQRIVRVQVAVSVRSSLRVGATVDAVINIAGTDYTSSSGAQSVKSNSGQQLLVFSFDYNPSLTGVPWTNATALAFTTGTYTFGVQAQHQPSETGYLIVSAVNLRFQIVAEVRVRYCVERAALGTGWRALNMKDANGVAAPWSKTAGHDYLAVFYMLGQAGVASLRCLDPSNVLGHEDDTLATWRQDDVPLTNGAALTLASGAPAIIENTWAPAFLSLRSGAATAEDSQAYALTGAQPLGDPTADPDNWTSMRQGISSEGAGTYGMATVVVRVAVSNQGSVLQDAPLEVGLYKTSDDSLLAGPASIDPGDVPTDGKWHVMRVRFPSAVVLTANEQVYLKCTSASTVGWDVTYQLVDTDANYNGGDPRAVAAAVVSIGGTVDIGSFENADGVQSHPAYDFPWSIGFVPPALTGLAATQVTVPNNPPGLSGSYRIQTLTIVSLAWTASALGAKFAAFDVQRWDLLRQNDADGVWHDIAEIINEATPYWYDQESALDVLVRYRVRTRRIDGGASDWSEFTPQQLPAPQCAAIEFVSNYAPDLPHSFIDAEGDREYTATVTGEQTSWRMLGERFPQTFQPAEGWADVFTRTLIVGLHDSELVSGATRGGRSMFDTLVDLLYQSNIPYVAVRDYRGRRWQAMVVVSPLRESAAVERYVIDVQVIENGNEPEPVVTAAPWTP